MKHEKIANNRYHGQLTMLPCKCCVLAYKKDATRRKLVAGVLSTGKGEAAGRFPVLDECAGVAITLEASLLYKLGYDVLFGVCTGRETTRGGLLRMGVALGTIDVASILNRIGVIPTRSVEVGI